MQLQRLKSNKGFTLLETLIAFALMSLSIATLYRVSIDVMGNNARQLQLYELTEFARSQLDEYVATGTNAPASGTYKDTWDWAIAIENSGDLPASYLDKTHYLAKIDITVSRTGISEPQVSLFILDFRKNP